MIRGMFGDQAEGAVRCEWGEAGVRHLGPQADAVVIVDVLSFSTCVDVALGRGAGVLPFRWRDGRAAAFAAARGARLASPTRRFTGGPSLSPTSLLALEAGEQLVLPSPNGGTLCALAEELRPGHVYAACLRNAAAVAAHLRAHDGWVHGGRGHGGRVLVVPAGEGWPDGTLRPALEDWLGAGAVIAALGGPGSPEAQAAAQAFRDAQGCLPEVVGGCSSGRELRERGFGADVALAAQVNVSLCVPRLQTGEFRPVH